jgi:hypothetical protein
MHKRLLTTLVAGLVVLAITLEAVDGKKAQYMGGTLSDVREKAEGILTTNNEKMLSFDAKKEGRFSILYSSITELEYGQKAGRRVAVAVLVSPLALFSKKRNHYLTITFKDQQGMEQAVVFELGKEIVRTSLKIIETRSGKQVQFQDEEARKSGAGGN